MRKRYPGKFEGCDDVRLAEVLHGISMDGCDEETGSVDELGWYGLIFHRDHGYIVEEDSNGFFTYTWYASKDAAQAVYNQTEAEYSSCYAEDHS